MASPKVIAKRYSKALFELVSEAKENPREVFSFLEKLNETICQSKELNTLLKSPIFSFEEKWSVVSELIKNENVSKKYSDFVKVLIETSRIEVLTEIVEEFKTRVLTLENSVEAFIESATQLSPEDLAQLQSSLEKLFNRKILPKIKINTALIAGVRVKVLGKTLDASLASSLKAIQKKLNTAQA
jgi:F-type H+-transporting ATPase subunit delta